VIRTACGFESPENAGFCGACGSPLEPVQNPGAAHGTAREAEALLAASA
jgi:hypothetical protein